MPVLAVICPRLEPCSLRSRAYSILSSGWARGLATRRPAASATARAWVARSAVKVRSISANKKSGKNAARPELTACHAFLQPSDTLVVASLGRYGRSLQDLITMVGELRRREIGFTSLHEKLDTTTPVGRLVFHVFAALAEFIRELIVIGTNEGLAAARARVAGRSSVVNPDIIRAARDMLPNPETSITTIAKLLGVSPGTLCNHITDLKQLRPAGVPRQIDGTAR